MSQLWDQIGQARREHHSKSYPGDLAADVLPHARCQSFRDVASRALRGALAVAAAVVLAWFWPEQITGPLRAAGVLPPTQSDPAYNTATTGVIPTLPDFPGLATPSSNADDSFEI